VTGEAEGTVEGVNEGDAVVAIGAGVGLNVGEAVEG